MTIIVITNKWPMNKCMIRHSTHYSRNFIENTCMYSMDDKKLARLLNHWSVIDFKWYKSWCMPVRLPHTWWLFHWMMKMCVLELRERPWQRGSGIKPFCLQYFSLLAIKFHFMTHFENFSFLSYSDILFNIFISWLVG